MTFSKAFILSVALIATSSYARSQSHIRSPQVQANPGFSIVIGASTAAVRLTNPIEVTITVTNDTDHAIYWSSFVGKDSQYAAFHYDLELKGHEAETTFFHRKMSGRNRPGDPHEVFGGSFVLLPHPPGKMFEMKINLKRLYRITEPGKYTLQVSRYDATTKTTVHSNTLLLTIEP